MDYQSVVKRAAASLTAGNIEEAERLFAEAAVLNPSDAGVWNVLALIAVQTAREGIALDRAKRAHELDRKHAGYLQTLGIANLEYGDISAAVAAFRRVLKAEPDSAEAHYNLGRALQKQGKNADAVAAYRRTSVIDPNYPAVYNDYASALFELGRYVEARTLLERAVAADPTDDMVLDNLARVVFKLEGASRVADLYRSHLQRYPDQGAARLSYASVLLGSGDFAAGWREYSCAARFNDRTRADHPDHLPKDLRERKVLLRAEQGLGDVLFFLRFARGIRERGARLTLECPPKLLPVLSGHEMFDELVPQGRYIVRPEGYDFVLYLGDLPALLESDDATAGFSIKSDPARVERLWNALAMTGPAPYIGLTWRAGLSKKAGPEFGKTARPFLFKEVKLAKVGEIFSSLGGTVVVLQRNPLPGEVNLLRQTLKQPVCDLSPLNEDLPEMTALLDLLDEYVGVSNTNMHLRKALGRTARVLVPYPAEWRWMFAEGESPWFPGFTVYRQAPGDDWTGALERLRADLHGLRQASGIEERSA